VTAAAPQEFIWAILSLIHFFQDGFKENRGKNCMLSYESLFNCDDNIFIVSRNSCAIYSHLPFSFFCISDILWIEE